MDHMTLNSTVAEEIKSLRENAESRAELAVQYSSGSRYPAALEPEIRLMLMILEDAVLCYQRYFGATDHVGRKEFADAERWLFGKSSDWVFSFENICECIGVGPEYLRDGLRAWKKAR